MSNFLTLSVFRPGSREEPNETTTKMNWIPLYILGKNGFCEEVRKKLRQSDIDIMPGYAGISVGLDMYWVDDRLKKRAIKEAVGAKLIWKHRLQFLDLEEFIKSERSGAIQLTKEEAGKIEGMLSVA